MRVCSGKEDDNDNDDDDDDDDDGDKEVFREKGTRLRGDVE